MPTRRRRNAARRNRTARKSDSVELERLIGEGVALIERRECLEQFRDAAATRFEAHTGSPWRPRAGSSVTHRTLTATMIDSRDFLAAKRRVETEPLIPAGPKIAFTSGLEFNDHRLIWDRLDKALARHPNMVLLHGGSPKGAERIAACWADNRKTPQIVFKPEWSRHGKAAPFKRNDRMLEILPIGVIVCPGSGISANLADKARMLGIPVWRLGNSGARALTSRTTDAPGKSQCRLRLLIHTGCARTRSDEGTGVQGIVCAGLAAARPDQESLATPHVSWL
jgi:hypothetical protein